MMARSYATYVFDCDGVVLDSNSIKTEAFRQAALPYGEAFAQALVDHHIAHGGVSRYLKFKYFLNCIVTPGTPGPDLDSMLARYADAVVKGLRSCAVMPGLSDMRKATTGARWLIVSGGDQTELREIFAERGLAKYFDGGIFGSPDTKDAILAREIEAGTIVAPAVLLGDSVYDFKAAATAGLDFVFVSGWTEVHDWRGFVTENGLSHVKWGSDLPTA